MKLSPQVIDLLKKILRLAKKKKKKLYIVGGYLRDIFLNREKENPDIDFCLKRGAINFGRELTKNIKCGFVILDKDHGACRLVKKIKDKVYTLDFTDFRGKTLGEDLLHRDFTINALCIELEKIWEKKNLNNFLVDPYNGRKDLKSKIIRMINPQGFDEDPLRILRAFSLSSIFGFKIDKPTLKVNKVKGKEIVRSLI